jgi:signal transduction histidine kinase
MPRISGSASQPRRLADTGRDGLVTPESRGELLHHFLRSAEEERQRLACGIHDDSIQAIAAARIRLQILRRTLEAPEQLEMLEALEEAIELSIARLRNLVLELRTPEANREGLLQALRSYLDVAERQAGIHWTLDERLAEQPSGDTGMLIYRIAQESLMNAVQHSGAQTMRVNLDESEGGLRLRITDDGIGFNPDALPRTRGLTTIRERAELAGGWLTVLSTEGSGTTIDCWIPELKSAASAELDPGSRGV